VEVWWLIWILIGPNSDIQGIEKVPTKPLHTRGECMKEMDRGLKSAGEGEWLACVPGAGLWL